MSNLRINIRFFMWHLQVTDDWKCSWSYNSAHKRLKYGWFDVYIFEPFRKK